MKKLVVIIVVLICLGGIVSCPSFRSFISGAQQDSIVDQSRDTTEEVVQTQAEINGAAIKGSMEYRDSIDKEYQKLLLALPQYKKELNKEDSLWLLYMAAARKGAEYVDCGSSTPMYVADVLNQATRLREASFRNLMLHLKGMAISKSNTTFSAQIIAEAYSAFIKAVGEDEYMEQKNEYIKALLKEQYCWNKWMDYRDALSKSLPQDIREGYDECTNLTMRTKLLQLKNQNQGLGLASDEMIECLLSDECSDYELLEYPGFNVVWKKHSGNTN